MGARYKKSINRSQHQKIDKRWQMPTKIKNRATSAQCCGLSAWPKLKAGSKAKNKFCLGQNNIKNEFSTIKLLEVQNFSQIQQS